MESILFRYVYFFIVKLQIFCWWIEVCNKWNAGLKSGCSSISTVGRIWSGFELLADLVLHIAKCSSYSITSILYMYMCQLHTIELLWWCHRDKYSKMEYFLLWWVFLVYYLLTYLHILYFLKKITFLARFPSKIWSGWTRHPTEAGLSPKRQETKKKKSWRPHRRWTCKEEKKKEDKWRRWT